MKSNCLLILEKFDDYCSRNHEMVNSMLDTFPSCIGCNDIIAIEEICKDSQVLNFTANYFECEHFYLFYILLLIFISFVFGSIYQLPFQAFMGPIRARICLKVG